MKTEQEEYLESIEDRLVRLELKLLIQEGLINKMMESEEYKEYFNNIKLYALRNLDNG